MAGYTALGASAAVADYDGDGFDDLFVTDSAADGRNHLYRNNGNFTFTDVAAEAGVDTRQRRGERVGRLALVRLQQRRPAGSASWCASARSQLFKNLGNGKFTRRVGKAAGLDRYLNAITAIAFDYDRDGDVDLFVGAYFQPVNLFNPDTPRFFPESFETANNGGGVIALPQQRQRHIHRRDRQSRPADRAAGRSTSATPTPTTTAGMISTSPAISAPIGSSSTTDDGTFSDITEKAIGIDTKKGMNVDWGDFDNDGLLDIYVTNITDDYMREGNFLWKNNGNLTFTDVSRETGHVRHRLGLGRASSSTTTTTAGSICT